MSSCQYQVTFPSIALITKDHQPVVRQNANFTPSVWDDYFIGFSPSHAKFEPNVERMEQLKREVSAILKNDDFADLGKTLSLIDDLQRLGIAYHFEEEIDASLTHLRYAVAKESDDHDISIVALRFRLMRQQGYHVSSDGGENPGLSRSLDSLEIDSWKATFGSLECISSLNTLKQGCY